MEGWIIAALITPGIACFFLYNFKHIYHDPSTSKDHCDTSHSFMVLSASRPRPLLEDAFCRLPAGFCSNRSQGKLTENNGWKAESSWDSKDVPLLWTSREDEFFHHVMSEGGKRKFLRNIFTEFSALEKFLDNIKYPTFSQVFETEYDLNSVAKDAFFLNFLLKTHLRSDDAKTSAILSEQLTLNKILSNGTSTAITDFCSIANFSTSEDRELTSYIVSYLCTASYEETKSLVMAFFNHMDWQRIVEKIHNLKEQKRRLRFSSAENRTLDSLRESLSQLKSVRSLLRLFYSLRVVLDELALPRKILRDTGWSSKGIQRIVAEAFELKEEKAFRDFFFPFWGVDTKDPNEHTARTSNSSENNPYSKLVLSFGSLANTLLKRFRWKSECRFDETVHLPPHTNAVLRVLNEINTFFKDFRKKTDSEKTSLFHQSVDVFLKLLETEKVQLKLPLGPCEGTRIVSESVETINDLMKEDVREEVVPLLLSNQLIIKTFPRLLKMFLFAEIPVDQFWGSDRLRLWLKDALITFDSFLIPFQQIFEERNGNIYLRDILDHPLFHFEPRNTVDNIKKVILNDVPNYIVGRKNIFEKNCSTIKMENVTLTTSLTCSLWENLFGGFSSPIFHKILQFRPNENSGSDLSMIFENFEKIYRLLENSANLERIPLKIVEDFVVSWHPIYFTEFENYLSLFQNRWPYEILNKLLHQWSPQVSHLLAKGAQVLEFLNALMAEIQPLKDYLRSGFRERLLHAIQKHVHAGAELHHPLDLESACRRQPNDDVTLTPAPDHQNSSDDVIEAICAIDFREVVSLLDDFNERIEQKLTRLGDYERADVSYVWNLIQNLLENSKSLNLLGTHDSENNSDLYISFSKEGKRKQIFTSILTNIFEQNLEVQNISAMTFLKLHLLDRIWDYNSKDSWAEFPQLNLMRKLFLDSIPLALREAVLILTKKPRIVHILHPSIMKEISICNVDLTSFGENIGQVWYYFCHLPYNELEEEMNRLIWETHVDNSRIGNFSINELAKLVINLGMVSPSFNENETIGNSSGWKKVFPSVLGVSLDEIYENGSTIWAATISPLVAESRSLKPKSEKLRSILVALDGHLRQLKLLLGMIAGGDVWTNLRDSYQDKPVVLQLFDFIEQSSVIVKELLQIYINNGNAIYELTRIRNFAEFCHLHQKMLGLDGNAEFLQSLLKNFLDFICNDERRELIIDQLNPKSLPVIDNLTMEPDAAVLGFLLDSAAWKLFMLHQGFLIEGHLQIPDWIRPFRWRDAAENLRQVLRRSVTDHFTLGLSVELNRIRSRRERSYRDEKLLKFLKITQFWMEDTWKRNKMNNSSRIQKSYFVNELLSLTRWFTQTKVFYEYISGLPVQDIVNRLCEDQVINLDPEIYDGNVHLNVNEIYLCEAGRIIYNIDNSSLERASFEEESYYHETDEITESVFIKNIFEELFHFFFSVDEMTGKRDYSGFRYDAVKEFIKRAFVVAENAFIYSTADREDSVLRIKVFNNLMNYVVKRNEMPIWNYSSPDSEVIEVVRLFSTKSKGGKWANLEEELLEQNLQFEQQFEAFYDITVEKFAMLVRCLSFTESCDELSQHFGFLEALTESLLILSSSQRTKGSLFSLSEEMEANEASLKALYRMIRRPSPDDSFRDTGQNRIISGFLRISPTFLNLLEDPNENLNDMTTVFLILNELLDYLEQGHMSLENFTEGANFETNFQLLQNFKESVNRVMELNQNTSWHETEIGTHLDNLIKGLELILNKSLSRSQIVRTTQLKDIILEEKELIRQLTAIKKLNSSDGFTDVLNREISLEKIQEFLEQKLNIADTTWPMLSPEQTENLDYTDYVESETANFSVPSSHFESKLIILKETNISLIFLKIENTSLHEMLRRKNISELELQNAYLKINYEAAMIEKFGMILGFIMRVMSKETKENFQKLMHGNIDSFRLESQFIDLFLLDIKKAKCGFTDENVIKTMTGNFLTKSNVFLHKERLLNVEETLNCPRLVRSFFVKENVKRREILDNGKILVGPNSSFTRAFVHSMNKTFQDITSHRTFLDNLRRIVESACPNSAIKNESERASKVLSEARWIFSTLEHSFAVSLGLIEQHFTALEHFCSFIQSNRKVLVKSLEGLSKIFGCFDVDKFEIQNSEADFDLQSQKLLQKNQFVAGVYFSEPRQDLSVAKSNRFSYKLNMNASEADDWLNPRRPYWRSNGHSMVMPTSKAFPENLLQLQMMVDEAILDVTTNKLQARPSSRQGLVESVAITRQNSADSLGKGNGTRGKRTTNGNFSIKSSFFEVYAQPTDFWCDGGSRDFFDDVGNSASFTLLVVISLFGCFVLVVTLILGDGGYSPKGEMRILHSYLLRSDFCMLVVCSVALLAVFAGLASILLKTSALLPLSETSLIFALVFLFGANILMVSHIVTSAIHSKFTSVFCAEILLVLLTLPFVCVMALKVAPSHHNLILTCLFPPSCFALGVQTLLRFEVLGIGGSTRFAWVLPTEEDGLPLSVVLLMLLLDFVLLNVIAVLQITIGGKGEGYFDCLKGAPHVIVGGGSEFPKTSTDKRENFNIFNEPRSSIYHTLSGTHLRTVKAVGLQKLFLGKGRRPAVVGENLSFEAFQNQVFVFYGPPKSGKTTVLSMIAGLMEPSSGYVTAQGDHQSAGSKKQKMLLSFCPSAVEANGFMTVREILLYFSFLKSDLKAAEATQRVETLLNDLELECWKNSLVSRLSKSLQKCVSISTAFAGDSKIILLDEPLNEADKSSLRPIWKLISKTKKEKTFIIASKETEEIECLADVVGILDKGKLIYTGSTSTLMEEFSPGYTVNIYNKQDIRMLFNVEQRIEEFRDHLLEYIPSTSFKSFDHEQGEIKFQLYYSDVQQHPDKLCILFRNLEIRSEEMGVSHVTVCHPSLKSILNSVIQNCGRGESATRASLDLLDLGTGFQRSSFPKFGSEEIRPEWQHYLTVFSALFSKKFLHNFRQMKVYFNVILLPILLFTLAMMSFWLIPTSDSERIDNTVRILNSDILNGFYAFPKEIHHWMDFEQQLNSILKESENNHPRDGYHDCDISEIKKNFLFKKDLHCIPMDDETVNFRDCSCRGNNCVLKINVGWHKLVIPFNKRHFKVLPFLEWSYLESHKNGAVLFYDRRKPKSLISLKTILATARIQSVLRQHNRSDSSLSFNLHSLGSVKEVPNNYLGTELVLLLPNALLLAGLTVGIVMTSSQVTSETERGEKRMITASGVPKFIYWSSCFAWDSLVVASTVLLMTTVVALFYEPRLVAGHHLVALFVLALLYGWSIQVITYLLGLLNVEGNYFFPFSCAAHLIIGLITSFVVFFCEEFSTLQDVDHLKNVIQILFLFFPQYAWMSGATEICRIYQWNSIKTKGGVNSPEIVSPFEWRGATEMGGPIGPHYLALFLWVVFGCVILGLGEVKENLLERYKRRRRRNSKNGETRAESYDDSNLSLLISGLKFDVSHNLHSGTVHFDAYACRGECLTIVGMRSAEKNSLFRYLAGEITAPTGTIYLVDEGGAQTPFEMNNNLIGLYTGAMALNPFLTAQEELKISAKFRGVSKRDMHKIIQEAVRTFDLAEFKDFYIRDLTDDVRKRIALSKTVIGDPKFVLLDEPNENASLTTRKIVTNLIKTVVASNRTVIVLSNCLEEAESISERLAIFENGRIVHIGKIGIQDPSVHGRYLVKIQAENGEDISPIIDVIKQEIQEFTIIEKYNTKIIADTSSEVTPYFIFGAISKARKVAPFWFEVSSMSLPQYYQRLGLHPTRNSSYSSAGESMQNEVPNSIYNEEDSCSTVTLPVFGKSGRDSFYDNLEEDFVPEKYMGHRRTLSSRVRRGSGSSKLTPCSTPQPPRTPVEGNPPRPSVERTCLSSPRGSIERSSLERSLPLAKQPTLSMRRNVSAKLKLPTGDILSPGQDVKLRQMSRQFIIPEEVVPMKKIKVYGTTVKNPDLMERFIENLPEIAPRASIESAYDISETSEDDESSSTSSEDRTEF